MINPYSKAKSARSVTRAAAAAAAAPNDGSGGGAATTKPVAKKAKKVATEPPSPPPSKKRTTDNNTSDPFVSPSRIFTNAFPWLFPGGIADFRDADREADIDASNWARHLLRQADGRFQRDKLWCFFVYNYCQRHRNNDDGKYFVNTHIYDPPKSLDELKEQLENGETSFVSKLIFYSKRVRGSDSYWRAERAKLYTWISHHIEAGNGPPDVFMTLSCSEYFWPDMLRLLEERIWIAEGQNMVDGKRCYRDGRKIDLSNNKTDRNKAINDYALVVQQFFIKRAEDFLNTVGKQVFGIDHYWGRIEFAKGRGQIHLHLLAILNKKTTKDLQDQLNDGGKSHDDQSKLVGQWAERVFGMTSSINGNNG